MNVVELKAPSSASGVWIVVDVNAAALAAASVPYVVAAIGAVGASVASKVQESTATATVQLGSKLLRRVLGREESASAVQHAVVEVAELPEDKNRLSLLQAELREAMQADPDLAADVAGMLSDAGVVITASGTRSVALRENSGIVQTGDDSAAWQGRGSQ
jgi:hypothetical protein